MPKIVDFNFKKINKGDKSELIAYTNDAEREMRKAGKSEIDYNALQVIDAKAQDDNYRARLARSFNVAMGFDPTKGVKFNRLDDDQMKAQEEKQKNFDVTVGGGTLAPTIGTDILPTIEALVRDTSLLSRVQIKEVGKPNEIKQLWDFDEEQDGEALTEVQAGNIVDDVPRQGDTLHAKNKVQASTKFSELAISAMDAEDEGKFLARLVRRVRYRIINLMLNGGAGVANQTARNGLWRGINNNYGVNGTGDAANFIGAITYATKAAADTALGAASDDEYDLAVKIKRQLLPEFVSEVEEEDYVYIMSRTTWGKISTVPDLNGRYKAQSAIDPTTGKVLRRIDGNDVLLFPGVATDFAFLVPLNLYEIITYGGLMNLNDGGLVQLREGLITYVSRFWGDGSMRYGHKYQSDTAATIGTTAVDNQAQNAFRYFKIS